MGKFTYYDLIIDDLISSYGEEIPNKFLSGAYPYNGQMKLSIKEVLPFLLLAARKKNTPEFSKIQYWDRAYNIVTKTAQDSYMLELDGLEYAIKYLSNVIKKYTTFNSDITNNFVKCIQGVLLGTKLDNAMNCDMKISY